MSVVNAHDSILASAQLRAIAVRRGGAFPSAPTPSIVAALAKHGGMYTLLDSDLMGARISAFSQPAVTPDGKPCTTIPDKTLLAKLQSRATFFFYKLVTDKPGYTVHAELINYLSEPGRSNGVTYDTGAEPSPGVPAAFTFAGQFVDHDLTFNGMNLTADENGDSVQDEASPTIDLDNVYGPRLNVAGPDYGQYRAFYEKIFDEHGKFRLTPVSGGFDVPRNEEVCAEDPNYGMAYIFDPRNDENQLLLQVHILIERLHNRLVDDGFPEKALGRPPKDMWETIDTVRKEVVANWQSFLLNEYLPAIIQPDTLNFVLAQLKIAATSPGQPQEQYGALKHKPYKDLTTGLNVVRMPHEFAIGFRFGHSQLRPMYLLNNTQEGGNAVLLFKDARVSAQVRVDVDGMPLYVDGTDDLRGHRALTASHVIDWKVFYPNPLTDATKSLRIDHKVTARVFNLPEMAIPDDIKYITNLPHRNLLRGSQIGVVCGEDLARFYGIAPLTPDQVLFGDDDRDAVRDLFKLDSVPDRHNGYEKAFKTPLWYYIIREAEVQSNSGMSGTLGELGSRLVAEVIGGAIFYSNQYAFDYGWNSALTGTNIVKLQDIIDSVTS